MLDQGLIGQNLGTLKYDIERGKIREFALAIGDPNPIYSNVEAARAAGYPDVPLPPTFPTTFCFWTNNDVLEILSSYGVPVARILHGEEEYKYIAPLYAGDSVTGTFKLSGIDQKTGKSGTMELYTFEYNFHNQRNEPVLNLRQLIVVR